MPTSKSFISISGISGDSKDPKHRGWIDLMSWSLDTSKSGGSGNGGGRQPPPPKSFHFVARMGAVSESLRRAVERGTLFDEVIVESVAGNRLIQRVRFEKVFLSQSLLQAAPEGRIETPVTFSADFQSMRATFGEETEKKTESSRTSWDLLGARRAG